MDVSVSTLISVVKAYSAHNISWGYSSAGRVLDWQSRGHGFEPRYLQKCVTARDDSRSRSLRSLCFSGVRFLRRAARNIFFSTFRKRPVTMCRGSINVGTVEQYHKNV